MHHLEIESNHTLTHCNMPTNSYMWERAGRQNNFS